MTGRDRVWTALKRGHLHRPPKGEILIEFDWLRKAGFKNLEEAIAYLRADLVVLPIVPSPPCAVNWREWSQSHVFSFGCLQGPVTFLLERLGWHPFSRLLIKQPLEARTLMTEFMLESVQQALAALDRGCEGIVIFDDLAGDKGLLINPHVLQSLYFPLIEQALEQLNCKDIPVLFHSDGNILRLVPSLKAAGFWGIQGLQPSLGLGPAFFHEPEMQGWVYWGNFDFEGAGRLKNIAEIENDVHTLLTQWQDFPGFIFGSSGGLYQGLSVPEIKAAYDAVENWKR